MRFSVVAIACLALGACTALPRPPESAPETMVPKPLSAPLSTQTVSQAPSVQPAEAYYETAEEDVFILRPQEGSDALPSVVVPPMSFSNASPFEIIRAVVESVSMGVALVGEHPNAIVQRNSVTVWNLGGKLDVVLERLSQYTGMFYTYRNGVITFTPDAQYMATLPPVEDLIDPVTAAVRSLGGTDVAVDRYNRLLSFRTNKSNLSRIEAYLKFARERRQVITYDVSIYSVQLNDSSQLGVNWNRFAAGRAQGSPWYQTSPTSGAGSTSGSTTGTTTGGSTGTGAVGNTVTPSVLPSWYPFVAGNGSVAEKVLNITSSAGTGMSINPFFVLPGLSADVLMNFLQSQGTLRSISQPRVAMLTGSKAAVRVGATTTYVSKVGTNTGSAITSTTVETAQIRTGVDLRINADYQDGTVFTDLQLALSDLVSMQSYVALGTTLQLPNTADRLIETKVRARPGDTIVIGGIQSDSLNNSYEGMPLPGDLGIPTNKQKQVTRSELVITLLPRVVSFVRHRPASTVPVASTAPTAPAIPAETAPVKPQPQPDTRQEKT